MGTYSPLDWTLAFFVLLIFLQPFYLVATTVGLWSAALGVYDRCGTACAVVVAVPGVYVDLILPENEKVGGSYHHYRTSLRVSTLIVERIITAYSSLFVGINLKTACENSTKY